MKKRFLTSVTALLLVFLVAFPAMAALQDMQATVYRWSGGYLANGTPQMEVATTGITYQVLAHGSDTAETLYAYNIRSLTSKTNPVTTTVFATDKAVQFKVDPTDSTDDRYVDLIVTDTVGGYSTFVSHFDKYTHNIIIDERPNQVHHGLIWYSASTTDEKSTGITFVADTMIHDVRTEVVTTSTGGTISVGLLSSGTGGDADGFIATRSAATAGYTADTGVITAGTSFDYTPASTYGVLLYTKVTGTSTGTAASYVPSGGRSYLGHIRTSATSGVLSYTASTTTNSGAGYIHYYFTRMR